MASKKALTALAALILALAAPSRAGAMEDNLAESEGSGLAVYSEPSGADIYVDGAKKGTTPYIDASLPAGRHYLKLVLDRYEERELTLDLPKNRRLTARLELSRAEGTIAAEAWDGARRVPASVLVNGEEAGDRPFIVKEGFASLVLRAFGYEDERRSVQVSRGEAKKIRVDLRRKAFVLGALRADHARFDPDAPGAASRTTLTLTASAPGTAALVLKDASGAALRRLGPLRIEGPETWVQWDGRAADGTPLPDGEYLAEARAQGDDGTEAAADARLVLRRGLASRPALALADAAGAFLCPYAETLPASWFELSAAAAFGAPPGAAAAYGPTPFAVALRLSPAERWEAEAALRMDFDGEGAARPAMAASAKRLVWTPALPLKPKAALVLRWAWAGSDEPSAFSQPAGVQLSLPLQAELGLGTGRRLVAAFSPSAAWRGTDGLPGKGSPEVGAAGALELQGRLFAAGASAAWTSGWIDSGSAEEGILRAAAQLRWTPPAARLAFFAVLGAWGRDSGGVPDGFKPYGVLGAGALF